MKSYADLVADAKTRIPEVSPEQLRGLRDRGEKVVVVDVRDREEVNLGKIPGALHISRGNLEGKIEGAVSRDARVVLYCASGNRSALAAESLQKMGYANVSSLALGFRGWVETGGDVE